MGVVYICGRTPLRCVGARAPAHTRACITVHITHFLLRRASCSAACCKLSGQQLSSCALWCWNASIT